MDEPALSMMSVSPLFVFVVGMVRSGTTLLEKLLSVHPHCWLASQPLQPSLVEIKRRFLEKRECAPEIRRLWARYPLNDMLFENHYEHREFVDFVEELDYCRIEGEIVAREEAAQRLPGGMFRRWARDRIERLNPPVDARAIGCKEVFCEEYLPFFLFPGSKAILVVRDPRDVLTSLDFGTGTEFCGQRKPLLFNIRQWRKSVAFALAFRSDPNLMVVRYEDLVTETHHVVEGLMDFLGLPGFPHAALDADLKDQSGEPWVSNSSHSPSPRINSASVGAFRGKLNEATDLFVQACCFGELNALGYQVEILRAQVEKTLSSLCLSEKNERPELASYLWSDQRRAEELERWRRLHTNRYSPQLFLFQRAFDVLSSSRASSWVTDG